MKMVSQILWKIGYFLIVFSKCLIADKTNPEKLELFFDKLEVKNGTEIIAVDLKIEKIGPTTFKINGYVEHFKRFNDKWKMTVFIYLLDESGNNSELLVSYPTTGRGRGVCSFLKTEYRAFFYSTLKNYSNAPHYDTCPLIQAKYVITDYPFNAKVFEKLLIPGNFLAKVVVTDSEPGGYIQLDMQFKCVQT